MFLYLDCPCTSFPRSFARDYKETYLYPPPSTIYGFLLSLVGEVNQSTHLGVRLAIGLIGGQRPISRIVRKQRQHKNKGMGTYSVAEFSVPNFQELLTDLQVAVRIDSSEESASVTLEERVAIALSTPAQIARFGGLSLGESWALVNGVRLYRETDGAVQWLINDNRGLIGLPVWIDRATDQAVFSRFSLGDFCEKSWVKIGR